MHDIHTSLGFYWLSNVERAEKNSLGWFGNEYWLIYSFMHSRKLKIVGYQRYTEFSFTIACEFVQFRHLLRPLFNSIQFIRAKYSRWFRRNDMEAKFNFNMCMCKKLNKIWIRCVPVRFLLRTVPLTCVLGCCSPRGFSGVYVGVWAEMYFDKRKIQYNCKWMR